MPIIKKDTAYFYNKGADAIASIDYYAKNGKRLNEYSERWEPISREEFKKQLANGDRVFCDYTGDEIK